MESMRSAMQSTIYNDHALTSKLKLDKIKA